MDDDVDMLNKMTNLPDPEKVDEDTLPKEGELDLEELLNHPLRPEQIIDCSAYDPIPIQTKEQWTGSDAV